MGDREPSQHSRAGQGEVSGDKPQVSALHCAPMGRGSPCGHHAGPQATTLSLWVLPSLAENAKLVPPVAQRRLGAAGRLRPRVGL